MTRVREWERLGGNRGPEDDAVQWKNMSKINANSGGFAAKNRGRTGKLM